MTKAAAYRSENHELRRSFRRLLIIALVLIGAAGVSAVAGLWWLALLFGLLALAMAAIYMLLWRSLPQVRGVVKVTGLRAPIEISRDSNMVPHIYAQHKLDAWFGLGYVHAQERLWQMEMQRRLGQGRLAELFGKRAVSADRVMRTMGLYRAALQDWETLPAAMRELVLAYVAGINSVIAARVQPLSPEWRLLRCKPAAWTGPDVLLGVKLMALNLGLNYEIKLLRHDMLQALGPELAELVMQGYPQYDPIPTPIETQPSSVGPLTSLGSTLQSLGMEGLGASGVGSNAWVVAGAKSVSGKPLLANDPHLMVGMPALWYMAHLSAADLDVAGATIPGLPGVVVGRNRSIAWGLTNLNPDVQDLFRERLDAEGRCAEFQGQMEPMTIVNETIKVRGQPDVALTVRISRHGPLLSDALNAARAARRQTAELTPREPLAMRWTALDAGDTTLAAFIAINEAHNWESFRQALQLCVAPAVNFVYADTAGHIGYQAAGRIPVRASGDGSLPVPGWNGEHEWIGSVPFAELPASYDPPEQMIVSANNCPVTTDYPHYLGRNWQPPFRAQRISAELQATAQHSLESFAALQGDTVSLFARELLPALLRHIHPSDDRTQRAAAMLARWDGDCTRSSGAAALFAAWVAHLPQTLLEPDVERRLLDVYNRSFLFVSRFLSAVLCEQRQPWFDRLTTPQPDGTPSKLDASFRAAIAQLTRRCGPEMEQWRWDRLHHVVFAHQPFHGLAPLRPIFSRALPHGGDWSTVNFGPFLFDGSFRQVMAAGYRQLVDLGRPDLEFVFSGGQAGHACSTHYDDYLADWHALRFRTLDCPVAPAQSQRATLRLEP